MSSRGRLRLLGGVGMGGMLLGYQGLEVNAIGHTWGAQCIPARKNQQLKLLELRQETRITWGLDTSYTIPMWFNLRVEYSIVEYVTLNKGQ